MKNKMIHSQFSLSVIALFLPIVLAGCSQTKSREDPTKTKARDLEERRIVYLREIDKISSNPEPYSESQLSKNAPAKIWQNVKTTRLWEKDGNDSIDLEDLKKSIEQMRDQLVNNSELSDVIVVFGKPESVECDSDNCRLKYHYRCNYNMSYSGECEIVFTLNHQSRKVSNVIMGDIHTVPAW